MAPVNPHDVLSQMWSIISILGPIYAICFGLLAVRLLIDKGVNVIFPKPTLKPKGKIPRGSILFERKQYPGLRYYRTRKGLRVTWELRN